MKIQIMVTAMGEDRPGIVAKLTEVVVKHSGNLEASRMSILGGEFAVISLITVPEENSDKLQKALDELKNDNLTILSKKTQPHPKERYSGYNFYEIALTGADHEGIVHMISAHLRDLNINFQRVETDIAHAPETGIQLFTMHASIAVPPSISYDELNKDLSKLADEAAVEIDLVSSAVIEGRMVQV